MKHIKRFENIKHTFIIGDIVTTLKNTDNMFIPSGITGIIENYHSGSKNDFDIEFFNNGIKKYWIRYDEIRFATNEEIEQYKLETSTNKYNI